LRIAAVLAVMAVGLVFIVFLSIAFGSEQTRTFVGLFLSTQITTAYAVFTNNEEILATVIIRRIRVFLSLFPDLFWC
jgi:hypothetical protein